MAEPGDTRFGFWIPVRDRASALYAVRMSGLPVFLIGLSLALSGILLLANPLGTSAVGWLLLAASVLLVGLGLMLRAGKVWPAPIAGTIFIVIVLLEAWLAPSWGLVVRGLIALVALSGMRGWLWLRRNPQ